MVSALSARLMNLQPKKTAQTSDSGVSGTSSAPSPSSRTNMAGSATAAASRASGANATGSSSSGYSADREETSSSSNPPLVLVDLHGQERRAASAARSAACPKRRKLNEAQFAAANIKADLERASMPFESIHEKHADSDKDGEKKSVHNHGDIVLNGVRLQVSDKEGGPHAHTIGKSNVSARATPAAYDQLFSSCAGFYAPKSISGSDDIPHPTRSEPSNSSLSTSPESNSDSASDRSTCSASDAESDMTDGSGSSNAASVVVISPLLEDSMEMNMIAKTDHGVGTSNCNIIASTAASATLSDMLQLSDQPRIVTVSTEPYEIIYANAAFCRLFSSDGAPVVGKPFASLLTTDGAHPTLPKCLVSSSTGDHKKLQLLNSSMASLVKVSPVVARKSTVNEIASVTHFAIQVLTHENRKVLKRSSSSISSDCESAASLEQNHLHEPNSSINVMG